MRRREVAHRSALLALVTCGTVLLASNEQTAVLSLLNPESRAILATGRPVTEILKESGVDITVAAAVRTRVDRTRFAAGFRDIERLQKGPYTPLIGRFSATPRVEDLSGLVLDGEDLEDLRDCRPRRCGMKLSGGEIQHVHAAIRAAGSQWKDAALGAFKQVLVRRAAEYQAHGRAKLIPYEDDSESVLPRAELEHLIATLERRSLTHPDVIAFLRSYPSSAVKAESYLFWSKDMLSDAKPIISITHGAILRNEHEAPIAVMVQVYASHYLNASISLTTLVQDEPPTSQLVYLRLTNTDVFEGTFGGLIRRIVQKRVRAEGPGALDTIRKRLEAGGAGVSPSP